MFFFFSSLFTLDVSSSGQQNIQKEKGVSSSVVVVVVVVMPLATLLWPDRRAILQVSFRDHPSPSPRSRDLGRMGPGGRVDRLLCVRRLEKRIYIPLPTEIGRKELFRINLGDVEVCSILQGCNFV